MQTTDMQTTSELEAKIIARANEDGEFRSRLLADPVSVFRGEYGFNIPDGYTVEVHEETGTAAHLVLPPSGRISDAELAAVAGGSPWDYLDNDGRDN